ncbi:MAG: BolA family transcriptional regulator [Chromatiales bacterium 21-64-14]|nr:MAG: BolA family transcriptional regulator [Chromatiales bacterium 21-64-14]HQU14933.1 BolA family protein [Gammaproteobacteria bacterium]
MEPQAIRQLIQQGFQGDRVEVTGDGSHFEALIVSESFSGKPLLERHRMVYSTLGDRMRSEIHALSMRTLTPDEWARQS